MIVTDEKILRQKSEPVETREEIEEIVGKLKKAIKEAWTNGCGLAAIQIGIPKQVAWYQYLIGGKLYADVLVNPFIIEYSKETTASMEGCLSIPNRRTLVKRSNWIRYENNGEEKTADGIEARVIQHEIDHINGELNIDKEYTLNKQGRNEQCNCGSGKKYKKCCGG